LTQKCGLTDRFSLKITQQMPIFFAASYRLFHASGNSGIKGETFAIGMVEMTKSAGKRSALDVTYARRLSECINLREIRSIPLRTGIMLRSIQSLMNSTTQRAQAKIVNQDARIVLAHYPKLNGAHH
jgi:hypothetical protein